MTRPCLPPRRILLLLCGAVGCLSGSVSAQLTDITEAPNPLNAGIQKSLEQQIGTDLTGDIDTPGSSRFIIARDPFRAIRRGRQLFQRKFTVAQGFGPRFNDGVGDIAQFNQIGHGLMDSCAGCHANPRGAAGSGGAIIFTRPDHRKSPHLFGVGLKEMLADEITADLRAIRDHAIRQAQRQGTPVTLLLHSKGLQYGSPTALPDGTVDTAQIEGVNPRSPRAPLLCGWAPVLAAGTDGGRLARCYGPPKPRIASPRRQRGAPRCRRLGLGAGRGGGHAGRPPEPGDDIPESPIDFFEFYLLHYFKPGTYEQTRRTQAGRRVMDEIGCTTCHSQISLETDRRVADVETVYDPARGIFNSLFATATALFATSTDNPALPPLQSPLHGPFQVRNIFHGLQAARSGAEVS